MEFIFKLDDKLCRVEIYNQYLKKIPELYKQIEISEKMYRKASIELEMLDNGCFDNSTSNKYKERLLSLMKESKERHASLNEELELIVYLKKQIESLFDI